MVIFSVVRLPFNIVVGVVVVVVVAVSVVVSCFLVLMFVVC